MLIDGKWVDARSGKKFDMFDPATGQAIAAAAEADAGAYRPRQRHPGSAALARRAVFAAQKCRLGLVMRTVGMTRARVKIGLANLAYNFTRLLGSRPKPRPSEVTRRQPGYRALQTPNPTLASAQNPAPASPPPLTMAQNHLLRGVQSVFQVHGVNAAGAVVLRRQFKCRQMVPFFTKLHRLRERLIAQRTQMINMLRGHVLCLIADEHSLRPIIDGLLAVHQQVDKQETILDVRVRKKAKLMRRRAD